MADPDRIAMARQMLAHLGVTLADLQEDLAQRPDVPTVAEYLPQVLAAAGPGARRTYGTYWLRMAAAYGSRPINTIAASDIEALQRDIVASALSRRNSRHGRHAGEHVIAAARAFYNRAIADGFIDKAASRLTGWSNHAGCPRPDGHPVTDEIARTHCESRRLPRLVL